MWHVPCSRGPVGKWRVAGREGFAGMAQWLSKRFSLRILVIQHICEPGSKRRSAPLVLYFLNFLLFENPMHTPLSLIDGWSTVDDLRLHAYTYHGAMSIQTPSEDLAFRFSPSMCSATLDFPPSA